MWFIVKRKKVKHGWILSLPTFYTALFVSDNREAWMLSSHTQVLATQSCSVPLPSEVIILTQHKLPCNHNRSKTKGCWNTKPPSFLPLKHEQGTKIELLLQCVVFKSKEPPIIKPHRRDIFDILYIMNVSQGTAGPFAIRSSMSNMKPFLSTAAFKAEEKGALP